MIVVVDALDECEDQSLIGDIIELFTEALVTFDLPLRLFFTSRPEPHIRAKVMANEAAAMTRSFALHEFDARNDIRMFLYKRLAGVYAERHQVMRSCPQPWPTKHDLEDLVHKSSGLFIFASTVIKYINDKRHNSNQRLKETLGIGSSGPSAYAGLDLLYLQILSSISDIPSLQVVLRTVICLFDPLSVEQLQALLNAKGVDVSLLLENLNSILLVPGDKDKPVQVFHQSLRDFLMDPRRSNAFSVNIFAGHTGIARGCIDYMMTELCTNGNIIEDFMPAIGSALQYAAHYWAGHLARLDMHIDRDLLESLRRFAAGSSLTWLETLRRCNWLDQGLRSLRQANHWLQFVYLFKPDTLVNDGVRA